MRIIVITLVLVSMMLHQTIEAQKVIPQINFNEFSNHLDRKNDTTYVINFWATWCKPCVEELPYFEALHQDYAAKPVKVLLVSLDFTSQIEKKLIPFVQDKELQSEVMVLADPDANTWIPAIDESWSGAIPATLIYRQGKKSFREGEFDSYEELKTIVEHFNE